MGVSRYKYSLSRVTFAVTLLYILLFVGVGVSLYADYIGGFFSASFITFVVVLVVLMVLSVPRYIKVDDRRLTVVCVMDRTEIEIDNIISIRKISPRKIGFTLPLFGSCGFLGFYGHFFNFRHFSRVLIYATEWRYMVEIIDRYEDIYYISCRERDRLITEVTLKKSLREVGD